MGNAEKLTPLIFLLVLLHLFRPGKKHGPFFYCVLSILYRLKKKIKVIKKGKLLGLDSHPDILRVLSCVPSPQTLGRIA